MGLDWCVRKPKDKSKSKESKRAGQDAPRYMTRLQTAKLKAQQETEGTSSDEDDEDDEDDYWAHQHISSYSGMHKIRRDWIDAALAWAASKNLTALRFELTKWVRAPTHMQMMLAKMSSDPMLQASLSLGMDLGDMLAPSGISYSNLPRDDQAPSLRHLREAGLVGLWRFVQHSDCDGQYSPGEAKDILQAYELLQPHLNKDTKQWCDTSVALVLKAAVKHDLPVEFC